MSEVYGILPEPAPVFSASTLGSEYQFVLKLAKQLDWQTGLELRSTRNASVKVRFGFTFHSSIAYRPRPQRATGTLLARLSARRYCPATPSAKDCRALPAPELRLKYVRALL